MFAVLAGSVFALLLVTIYLAWRQYLWASQPGPDQQLDQCPYSLTDRFGQNSFLNITHQRGVRWLTEIFSRSAARYPNHIALQIPHTGEALTYAELDAAAERIAGALSRHLDGPDQVVAVAMPQDNWQIVAAHLGVLKAGGTLVFLDTALPDELLNHVLEDAQPVVVLTRGEPEFRALPTVDVLTLSELESTAARVAPWWLDDPEERLATIFYTSGTTGMPKGVECAHAGYVNLALTYADYFDLLPGMDATTLTSSLGYDGSISEMYSAWVSGCSVVLLTKEQVRSGPELVSILREAEVTVLFCPPVLLPTMTARPEIDLPYPLCRYIIPAGEAFPDALVEPWTRGRRQIINTYGPTEASTDTSRQSLRPGDPVTIGTPFANVTYVILEFDGLNPVRHGDEGELCIGGVHLARGYRNLAQQTAKSFIKHPKFGRLYRTGDKCRIDTKTHRVHFLGRYDAQLKVRGQRVEAQAVESMLQSHFREIDAAVLDYQNEALIAFVLAPTVSKEPISVVAAAPAEWAARVTSLLAEKLPEASIPSRVYLVEKFEMKPLSGKIDRKRLPDLAALSPDLGPGTPNSPYSAVRTDDLKTPEEFRRSAVPEADPELAPEAKEILAICRAVFESPIGWDDTFVDLGGHSLLMARLAERLHAAGWSVPVRALLTDCNTVRKIAERPRVAGSESEITSVSRRSESQTVARDSKGAQVLAVGYFTLLQMVFSLFLYAPGLLTFVSMFAFLEFGEFFTTVDIWAFVIIGTAIYLLGLLVPFAILLWAIFVKLVLNGLFYRNKIQPGLYPKWSRMHLRIWCIDRLQKTVLLPLGTLYRSAPLMAFALRYLGAQVGCNLQCAKDARFSGPLDLVSFDDNVAIQTGAYICTARWEAQNLHVGPIHFESGSKLGMRAGVGNHVTVGRDAWIAPFTPILNGVGPGELWEGSPARATGRHIRLKRTTRDRAYALPFWFLETLNIVMQVGVFFFLTVLPAEVILWSARELLPIGEAELPNLLIGKTTGTDAASEPAVLAGEGIATANYFAVAPLYEIFGHIILYAFITMWLTLFVTSILGSLFIRMTAASPGIYGSRSLEGALLMYRMSMLNTIQRLWTWTITGQYLRVLAGLHLPRTGASECDVMFNLVPEVASADSKVFWSNGGFTNVLDYDSEHITLRQIDMPENFFSGNNSVAEYGNFPDNFLLGVSTPCSDILYRRQMRTRRGAPITVAGSPPLEFARASFNEEEQNDVPPSFSLFLGRVLLNDIFSIGFLRAAEVLVFTIVYISLWRSGFDVIVSAVLALVLTEPLLVGLSVLVKWSLVGNNWGRNHAAPFWSPRHFTYFFAQDCFFIWCRGTLGLLGGTILSNGVLRLLGCQVGRRTILSEPMQCSDWNAVRIGKDCVVDGFLQLHTFENMMLQVKETRLGDGTTVAFGATILKGAVTERDTTLRPLSMALKEMHIPSGIHEGSPAEKVQG